QDLRLVGDPVGEDDLLAAEPGRVQQLVPPVAHRRSAVTGVGVVHHAVRGAVVRVVQLPRFSALRGADDRVVRGVRAEVDPRLVVAQVPHAGNAPLDELRPTVGGDSVAAGGDHAEPVGEHGVVVDPAALTGTAQVQLTHRDHRVGALPVDVVTVHREGAREG